MGCDMHLHIEVKTAQSENKWIHYQHPHVSRDYRLFARMAGVRGTIKPLVRPRGFPVDASEITQIDFKEWDSDAHTPSHLDAEEVRRLVEIMRQDFPGWDENEGFGCYYFGNEFSSYESGPAEIVDLRFVFWFDN